MGLRYLSRIVCSLKTCPGHQNDFLPGRDALPFQYVFRVFCQDCGLAFCSNFALDCRDPILTSFHPPARNTSQICSHTRRCERYRHVNRLQNKACFWLVKGRRPENFTRKLWLLQPDSGSLPGASVGMTPSKVRLISQSYSQWPVRPCLSFGRGALVASAHST